MFPFPPVVRSFLFSLFERAWLRTALCFCLCATVCASCSVDRHMEKKAGELMARMDAVPDWRQLPRKEISWHQALAMMMERNIDLKKSEQSLKTTKRSVINVFTQIIPGVNLDWMLTKELSDLAKVTASDVEYNTNILFNMPSLTQIPFDYYSAKAAVYTAEKTLEMARIELNRVMVERKTHEKLRERAFEEFKQEIAQAESKEIDELVSYNYHEG